MSKQCTNCGAAIPENSKFCEFCGKPVEAEKKKQPVCLHCGAPIAKGDAFCTACGAPVEAPVESEKAEKKQPSVPEETSPAAEEPLKIVKLQEPETEPVQENDTPSVNVHTSGSEQARAAAKETAANGSTRAYCQTCGAPLAADDKFCTACGAPVAATASGQEAVSAAAEEPLHIVKLADDVPVQGPESKETAVTHCLSCGAVLAADDKFCTICGAPIAATASGQEAVTVAAEEPLHTVKLADDVPAQGPEAKGNAVTHCPSCGAVLAADDKFCTTCGAPVEAKPAVPEAAVTSKTMYCRSCGAVVNAGDAFCASCGAPIRAASQVKNGNGPLPVVHLHDEIPPHTGPSGQPGTGGAGVPPAANGAALWVKNIKPLLSVIAAIAAILLLLFKFSSGGAVQEVKEITLDDFSKTVTVGQAFDRRFEEEDWSSEGSGKVKTVIFKGRDKDTGKMWKVYFKVTEGKDHYWCEVTKIVVDQTVSTNKWDLSRLLTYVYDG